MQTYQFDNLGELEDAANSLARASRHPVYADLGQHVEDDSGDSGIREPHRLEKYLIWNERDQRPAYFGSKRYNLIQHREVVDAVRAAVDATVGTIDKGVIHDYGEKVDGVVVFGNTEEANIDVTELVGDGYVPPEGDNWVQDRLGLGMRFQNSFDGRSKVGGSTMGYRYICANWMVWGEATIAERQDMHLKRGGEEVGVDPGFFEDIVAEVFEEQQMVEAAVESAVDSELLISRVPGLLREAGFGRGYAREIMHVLLDMDSPSAGVTTRWHVYNAATSLVDHHKADGVGPSVYQDRHESAWSILTASIPEPEESEGEVNPTAFARPPTA